MVCCRTNRRRKIGTSVLDKLKLIGTDKGGLYLFDRDLEGLAAAEGKA